MKMQKKIEEEPIEISKVLVLIKSKQWCWKIGWRERDSRICIKRNIWNKKTLYWRNKVKWIDQWRAQECL